VAPLAHYGRRVPPPARRRGVSLEFLAIRPFADGNGRLGAFSQTCSSFGAGTRIWRTAPSTRRFTPAGGVLPRFSVEARRPGTCRVPTSRRGCSPFSTRWKRCSGARRTRSSRGFRTRKRCRRPGRRDGHRREGGEVTNRRVAVILGLPAKRRSRRSTAWFPSGRCGGWDPGGRPRYDRWAAEPPQEGGAPLP